MSSYKKSTKISVSDLKRDMPFLDETFVIASAVRTWAEFENLDILENMVFPKVERQKIKDKMRAIVRTYLPSLRGKAIMSPDYRNLQRLLDEEDKKLGEVKSIYAHVYPRSPKVILQYIKEKAPIIPAFFNQLPHSEQVQFKVICNNELIDYSPEAAPQGQSELQTRLKPYFGSQSFTVDEIKLQVKRSIVKAESAVRNAQENSQKQREKKASYKIRKLTQALSILERISRNTIIYGKKLKGVKSYIIVNGKTFPWPKYLLGNFKFQNRYVDGFNQSLLYLHSIVLPNTEEIPVLAIDNTFLFCEDATHYFDIKKVLSPHEFNKFRAFSHYEISLSPEYPVRNSIAFPYSYR
ncbi:hypothetical protein GCM10011338_40580 [Alteromonas lipolytica]|uniref:Uncharacterized protein n=2 Tax=Alteromonas lipolytica TaxID=1856405 RepID=A0A1E8FE52_9ALTE|nr:hypothetical protein BFC17_21940 [Alteromonas lipolytica]GGF84179.1 hypothetical protein GCM10011338_40580 [Alteromonas lipolytica]